MKPIKTSQAIVNQAREIGIKADVLAKSKAETRRHSSLGSTHAPQKKVVLNGIRMSLGQARQYVAARGKRK